VLERRKWPGMGTTRWCTSDFKRGPIHTLFTLLADEFHGGPYQGPNRRYAGRPCRILDCQGMRAEESPNREKMAEFELDHQNSRREVWTWLPIKWWPVEEVWSDIRRSGVPHNPVYDHGMPRLSCTFCIYANEAALKLAGRLRPELLDQYVQIERETNHTFKPKLALAQIQQAIRAGEQIGPVADWRM
jgi:3'-phosphoadenosine 5'-phosphosulfate sulfotransferase (PAPS reductase)/FAD synthetase